VTPKAENQVADGAETAVLESSAVDILDTGEAGTKLIRGGVLRVAGYVAGVLVGLVSTPLMVRHLGVADFGHFITVSSLIFIVGGLTDAGLINIGTREYVTREAGDRARFVQLLVGMRLALTAAAVAAAVGFAFIAGYGRELRVGTLIAGLGLLMTNLQSTFVVPLATGLRLGWVAALDLIRQIATAALFALLVLAGAGLLSFFWVSVATGGLVLVITAVLVRRDIPLFPAVDVGEWRELLRETLPFAAASALGVVYFRVAVILMSLISTPEQTGYFSVSFRILEIVSGIPWLLVISAFPILARAARDDESRLRYALQRLFEVDVIVGVWLALALFGGAPFAIEVVGGDKFEPSIVVLRILGLALVGTFLVATWGFALLSLHRHMELFVANALAILIGGGLTVLLVPKHGAEGAAIATTATEFALAAIYAVMLARGRGEFSASPKVLPPVALATLLAAATLAVPVHDVARVALASAVYFGVLGALRAIPAEVMDALPIRRRGRPA
jgi:O-antigen/teichoic acid export membrane protein